MLNLQKEVERILDQAGDYYSFKMDEQFSRIYRISDAFLEVSKLKNNIVVAFLNDRFEFQRLPYNPGWYPIQAIKDNDVIPIVINYENGRAHSARNWNIFLDLAKEVSKKLTGIQPEVMPQNHR